MLSTLTDFSNSFELTFALILCQSRKVGTSCVAPPVILIFMMDNGGHFLFPKTAGAMFMSMLVSPLFSKAFLTFYSEEWDAPAS